MAAALRGERPAPVRARAKMSADATLSTGAKASRKAGKTASAKTAPPAGRGVSKMAAARKAGLPPGLALAAGLLIVALVGVAVLATGGRGAALVDGVAYRLQQPLCQPRLLALPRSTSRAPRRPPRARFSPPPASSPASRSSTSTWPPFARGWNRSGWVEHARVIRLLPDTVVIAVDQRPLMAVWEHGGRAMVVANNGAVVSQVDPAHFTTLPLVVGEGANTAARRSCLSIQARPRLAARLEALVRVDGRRWDLRLKDGTVILLPAEAEGAALARLDDLDRTSKVLDLGLARVDLRDPEMVVVRPRQAAGPVEAANAGAKSGA